MRLYNVYCVCKKVITDLNNVYINSYRENEDFQELSISHLSEYRRVLEELYNFSFIKYDAEKALKAIAPLNYLKPDEKFTINSNDGNELLYTLNTVCDKVKSVIDLYESMKEATHKPGIDIYVPPCKYLKEYTAILKEIDFIINQCPYLKSDGEEIQYNGTDIGSDWITLVIVATGTVASLSYILNNFAEITKKVQEIRVRFQMIKQNEEFLKTLNAKNELINELQELYDKAKEEAFSKATAELKQSLGNLNDGEEEGKVLMSLKKYNDLLDMGVRFYSSIDSPPEIKELLPSSDDPKALTDTIVKYIENKDDKK